MGPHVMQCYYEVLEVDRKASVEEIRVAYKKMALRYHPDKNHGQVEEAERRFKEVQHAYTVLSDPDERAWYDSHRESILRGDNEGTSAPDEVNLFNYFSASCYDGFNDEDGGFFAVYRGVFELVREEEAVYDNRALSWPRFGDSTTEWNDVAAFYATWRNFSSFKTFAWKDEYKINEIPDRASRRMAERINMKERAAAKKAYTQTVQELVGFVHRRDPRVKRHMEEERVQQRLREEEKMRRDAEAAKRRRAANEKIWAEAAEQEMREEAEREARGEAMDGTTLDILYEQQRRVDEMKRGEWTSLWGVSASEFAMLTGDDSADVKGGKPSFHCPACKKQFQSLNQYNEHIKSSKHKGKLRQLAQKGVDVDELMGTKTPGMVESDAAAPTECPSRGVAGHGGQDATAQDESARELGEAATTAMALSRKAKKSKAKQKRQKMMCERDTSYAVASDGSDSDTHDESGLAVVHAQGTAHPAREVVQKHAKGAPRSDSSVAVSDDDDDADVGIKHRGPTTGAFGSLGSKSQKRSKRRS